MQFGPRCRAHYMKYTCAARIKGRDWSLQRGAHGGIRNSQYTYICDIASSTTTYDFMIIRYATLRRVYSKNERESPVRSKVRMRRPLRSRLSIDRRCMIRLNIEKTKAEHRTLGTVTSLVYVTRLKQEAFNIFINRIYNNEPEPTSHFYRTCDIVATRGSGLWRDRPLR